MARYVWLFILLCSGFGFAQPAVEWERTYNWSGTGNYMWNMELFGNGNVLIDGYAHPPYNGLGQYVFSVNSSGDSVWSRALSGRGPARLIPSRDGSCLLAQQQDSILMLCRINSLGDTLQTGYMPLSLQRGYIKDILQVSDEAYLVHGLLYGSTWDTIATSWVYKISSAGDRLWYREYPVRTENGLQGDTNIIVTPDEGFLQYGVMDTMLHVTKCNSSGEVLWMRTYSVQERFWPNAACLTPDNGFILVGFRSKVRKHNASGDILWTRQYPATSQSHFYDVSSCWDGGYIISGDSLSERGINGSYRAWLLKINGSGDSLWSRFGPPVQNPMLEPWESHILQTPDSGYLWGVQYGWLGYGSRDYYTLSKIAPDVPSAVIIEQTLPQGYALHGNFPNPFNPTTTITFDLPKSEFVTLTVFDLLGREVAELCHDTYAAGSHTLSFDGGGLPSGIYLYRIHAGGFSASQKMMLLK